MNPNWERFLTAAHLGQPDQVPVALIVDSPWLPDFAGIDTRDYFLFPEKWMQINLELLKRFPDVVWIPGFWVEFGMAAEPSAFGCRMRFYPNRPPSIEPLVKDLAFWQKVEPINPAEDGLMPLALRLYQQMDLRLQTEGLGIHMVAARGPLTTTSWLTGITALMEGLVDKPEEVDHLLGTVTTSLIRWLEAQLESLQEPQGILLLDDLVGMVSRRTYQSLVEPHLKRIFEHFSGLLRIYHNDTPCQHLLESLSYAGFDVFNFSHQTDIALVKQKMGDRVALMGNIAPLDLGVRGTPQQVYSAATECLDKAAPGGGMILSFGGGISPGTLPENIDALTLAARDWKNKS
ncbi:MAG: uroporphyrinogen decarboxylase [Chloroflexi bacterium HGW-Chloroflexi-10]|nr:MAG: uroporphyrinogen decarboxylase [Chloroflexi bacterium HGW-Chloroflexi-10]